jgi:hypothetical protein
MSDTDEGVIEEFNASDDSEPNESTTPEPEPDDADDTSKFVETVIVIETEDPGALEQMKAQDAYTERSRKYLAKNMGDVYGDEAVNYLECPFCNHFGTPGYLHLGPCPPTLIGLLYEYAQVRAPDEYIADIYSRVCERCNGLGSCASGSKVAGQERLSCIDCRGAGWIAVGDERRSGSMIVGNGPAPLYPPPASDATSDLGGTGAEPPEAEALRKRGYAVIPPMPV